MADLSRAFDEELRARLASLARALRSVKIIKQKLGIPPVTAKQGKIRLNSLENATKSIQHAAKMPEGTTNGTNGAPTEPKGTQKVAKGSPKCSQNDSGIDPESITTSLNAIAFGNMFDSHFESILQLFLTFPTPDCSALA